MKYLYYVAYTITLMLCWALLRAGYPPEYWKWGTMAILLYTFYSSYEVRRVVEKETTSLKVIKLLGPIFIIGAYVFFNELYWFSFLNPLMVALGMITAFTVLSNDRSPSRTTQFFTLSFIFVYSTTLVPEWQRFYKNTKERKIPNFELNQLAANTNPEPIPNLDQYQFLNQQLDTVNLAASGKYTLIETWNERCVPCVRAMKELGPFYNALGNGVQQRYLYIPARKGYALDYPKIFSYQHIQHHRRILVDVNLQEMAALEGYPNFLLFDPAGQLVLRQHGYSSAQREAFEAKIKAMIQQKT